MGDWFEINFEEMFSFHRAPLDTFLRGSLVYLAICILLRVIPKRQAGKLSPNDLIVLVLIGGMATTALELAPMSVPDVLLVIVTILLWSLVVDWLAFRFPALRPLLLEPPTRLIEDGRMLVKNLRRELVTEEEVLAQLRVQGVHQIDDIKQACLETDGTISVVKDEGRRGADERTTAARSVDESGDAAAEPSCSPSALLPGSSRVESGERPAGQPDDRDDDWDGLKAEMSQFLDAADKLQRRLRWHQQRIDTHQAGIGQIKALLSEHGIRVASPPRRKPTSTEPSGGERKPTGDAREAHKQPSPNGAGPAPRQVD